MHKHFNDAELLQHLDGELPPLRRWRVQLHLFRCWECRARKAALEVQAHRFAQAVRTDCFPGPDRVSAARARFERWRWEGKAAAPEPERHQMHTWRATAAICGFALAGLAGLALYPSIPETPASAPVAVGQMRPGTEVALNQLDPAPSKVASAPQVTAPAPVVASTTAPPNARQPVIDLDLVEADVHYRLHRIGACAGEPILIARRGGHSLSVTAVGPPEHRSREIRQALDDLRRKGLVHVETTAMPAQSLPVEALGDAGKTGGPPAALLHSPIARRFGSDQEFARTSSLALRLAESIYAQAWALQRHAKLPLPDKSHRSPAGWLAEAMRGDHIAQIQTLVEQLNEAVAPLSSKSRDNCTGPDASAFDVAAEVAALTHRVFAPSTAEELASAETDSERLRDAIVALLCAVR